VRLVKNDEILCEKNSIATLLVRGQGQSGPRQSGKLAQPRFTPRNRRGQALLS
jgi:hypothetical protein